MPEADVTLYSVTVLIFYLFFQIFILAAGFKLIHWDAFQKKQAALGREPESKERYCLALMFTTLLTFGTDVWIICIIGPVWLELPPGTMALYLPFVLIPVIMTLYKAGLLRLLWLNWSVERLKKKLDEKD